MFPFGHFTKSYGTGYIDFPSSSSWTNFPHAIDETSYGTILPPTTYDGCNNAVALPCAGIYLFFFKIGISYPNDEDTVQATRRSGYQFRWVVHNGSAWVGLGECAQADYAMGGLGEASFLRDPSIMVHSTLAWGSYGGSFEDSCLIYASEPCWVSFQMKAGGNYGDVGSRTRGYEQYMPQWTIMALDAMPAGGKRCKIWGATPIAELRANISEGGMNDADASRPSTAHSLNDTRRDLELEKVVFNFDNTRKDYPWWGVGRKVLYGYYDVSTALYPRFQLFQQGGPATTPGSALGRPDPQKILQFTVAAAWKYGEWECTEGLPYFCRYDVWPATKVTGGTDTGPSPAVMSGVTMITNNDVYHRIDWANRDTSSTWDNHRMHIKHIYFRVD